MKLDSNITAIITGGASGLGEATARMMASKGVKVGIFDLNEERGEAVAKELGDVLWYVSVLAKELDYDLESIAKANVEKLLSRQQRGVLTGSGDNR